MLTPTQTQDLQSANLLQGPNQAGWGVKGRVQASLGQSSPHLIAFGTHLDSPFSLVTRSRDLIWANSLRKHFSRTHFFFSEIQN